MMVAIRVRVREGSRVANNYNMKLDHREHTHVRETHLYPLN